MVSPTLTIRIEWHWQQDNAVAYDTFKRFQVYSSVMFIILIFPFFNLSIDFAYDMSEIL
jgi:hypothetical protein